MPRRFPQAGFTMIELMIVCVIMTAFSVTALAFATHQQAAERQHATYTQDLVSSRSAMDRIVADLRRASAVQQEAAGDRTISIHTAAGVIRYGIQAGLLVRTHRGQHQRIASCIARVECRQAGQVAHLRLLFRKRAPTRRNKQRGIQTSVALRLAPARGKKG